MFLDSIMKSANTFYLDLKDMFYQISHLPTISEIDTLQGYRGDEWDSQALLTM